MRPLYLDARLPLESSGAFVEYSGERFQLLLNQWENLGQEIFHNVRHQKIVSDSWTN